MVHEHNNFDNIPAVNRQLTRGPSTLTTYYPKTHTHTRTQKLNEPVDSPDFGRQQELPNMTPDLASATIDTPSSTFTQQPMSPTKPHPQAHTPPPLLAENPDTKQPSPSPAVIDSSNELISLRQALQAAEEQTQLINDEYRKLLKGKEVRVACACTL